jgi:RNA-directed DNA polymerase
VDKITELTIEQAKVKVQAIKTDPLSSSVELWETINFKRAKKHVTRLQERIYRATKNQQWKKVKTLQKLLVRSYYNKILAIRDVTQKSNGKNTPGVDNKIYDSSAKRWELLSESFDYSMWKALPVKRIFIPKTDGTKRPLGIPTVKDRIMQTIVKRALEAEWEARFEPRSFGFRPGRCTMEAISEIRDKMAWSKTNVWVLDADISKCFDNISHEPLLRKIPVFKTIIRNWLKAGVITFGEYAEVSDGTPQGGVISPLLANIALTGMERLFTDSGPKGISLVRFADDFVVIASSKVILEKWVLPKITTFLNESGLSINKAKTKIVHREEGFSFLGFTLQYFKRSKKSILLVTPSKRNKKGLIRKCKETFKESRFRSIEEVIDKMNPILRGWLNYFGFVNSRKSFSYVNYRIYRIIWRELKRKHPQKSAKWIIGQYLANGSNKTWLLSKGNHSLTNPTKFSLRRYTKVNISSSPLDRSNAIYWNRRASMN